MALWGKKSAAEEKPKKTPVVPPIAAAAAPPAPVPSAAKPTAAKETAKPLSAEDMKARANASAQTMLRFGEIVSVLMGTPQFRNVTLQQAEALVLPPLLSGQYLVAESQSKDVGFITPVAVALWATVSVDVDKRLSEHLDKPMTLAAKDWKSGDIPWLIVLAGNTKVITPLAQSLQKTTLKGKPLKLRATDKEGKPVVTAFTGETVNAST